jgi:hypothetical protein
MNRTQPILLTLLFCLATVWLKAQEIKPWSDKLINTMQQQYQKAEGIFDKQSSKWLAKLQKQEKKLQQQLAKTDSAKAAQLFGDVDERYANYTKQLQQPNSKLVQYVPGLDSLATATNFLNEHLKNRNTKVLSGELQQIQSQLQNANKVKQLIQQRKKELQQQLKETPLAKQLQQYNQTLFYYQQQINEYKELWSNPDKLMQKAMSFVRELPLFKDFFAKNSHLAQLFAVPAGYGTPQSLAGLQTTAGIQQLFAQRYGTSLTSMLENAAASGGGGSLPGPLGAAQQQLNQAKAKIKNYGTGSITNSNDAQWDEDGIAKRPPNTQKTKTFLQRLQFGFNTQSQRNNTLLPTITDLAVTVGYKLNDNATAGIGAAYKIGLGNGWNNIKFTNEGIGIRSFVDVKFPFLKKIPLIGGDGLWLTGGFEMNYLPTVTEKLAPLNLKDIPWNAWQQAGMFGLSKKNKVGNKTIKTQLLYNFLYKQTLPHQPELMFRIGWER